MVMHAYKIKVLLPDITSPRWITMIAPECNSLEDARVLAETFFGHPVRILDVIEPNHLEERKAAGIH